MLVIKEEVRLSDIVSLRAGSESVCGKVTSIHLNEVVPFHIDNDLSLDLAAALEDGAKLEIYLLGIDINGEIFDIRCGLCNDSECGSFCQVNSEDEIQTDALDSFKDRLYGILARMHSS